NHVLGLELVLADGSVVGVGSLGKYSDERRKTKDESSATAPFVLRPSSFVHPSSFVAPDAPGYDLIGLLVGSEGTFAIVTKVMVRLMRIQESVRTLLAIFNTVDEASQATSAIIAHGIIPAALEMMDGLTIKA